jgi:hypothetical protein
LGIDDGRQPRKKSKAAASWLKWDGLGATVGADNANPPATSIELLTSDEDIVKLGLSFYKSLNSHASSINSKNFLATVVAKINGDGDRVIESREELVRSLRKKSKIDHRRIRHALSPPLLPTKLSKSY